MTDARFDGSGGDLTSSIPKGKICPCRTLKKRKNKVNSCKNQLSEELTDSHKYSIENAHFLSQTKERMERQLVVTVMGVISSEKSNPNPAPAFTLKKYKTGKTRPRVNR
ncbi:hypothetical protein NDU88_004575 [Pleurodeles waltl]|uniref:Uncharacterized protein n=1 Tax=Pleurodeles waltl TaxID=8319 RepID=A0AAV7PG47_PLEWA|nr:hypothetical protein NDU88_004575 [Pleurodeles waltl]